MRKHPSNISVKKVVSPRHEKRKREENIYFFPQHNGSLSFSFLAGRGGADASSTSSLHLHLHLHLHIRPLPTAISCLPSDSSHDFLSCFSHPFCFFTPAHRANQSSAFTQPIHQAGLFSHSLLFLDQPNFLFYFCVYQGWRQFIGDPSQILY